MINAVILHGIFYGLVEFTKCKDEQEWQKTSEVGEIKINPMISSRMQFSEYPKPLFFDTLCITIIFGGIIKCDLFLRR